MMDVAICIGPILQAISKIGNFIVLNLHGILMVLSAKEEKKK